MDSDLANIALICFLMGVGVVMFVAIILVYLALGEIFETWYLED